MEFNYFFEKLKEFCKKYKFKLKPANIYQHPEIYEIRNNKYFIFTDELFQIINNEWNKINIKNEDYFYLETLKFVRKYKLIQYFKKEK